jgi:hypothetical protein
MIVHLANLEQAGSEVLAPTIFTIFSAIPATVPVATIDIASTAIAADAAANAAATTASSVPTSSSSAAVYICTKAGSVAFDEDILIIVVFIVILVVLEVAADIKQRLSQHCSSSRIDQTRTIL